jgi:hypothetical protein
LTRIRFLTYLSTIKMTTAQQPPLTKQKLHTMTTSNKPFMTDLQVRRMKSWQKKAEYWHSRFQEATTEEDKDKYIAKAARCIEKAYQDVPRPTNQTNND